MEQGIPFLVWNGRTNAFLRLVYHFENIPWRLRRPIP
jgi:hypothetical protein